MQVKIFSLIAALVAAVVVVGGSGAGTTKVRKATQIDVSTRSAVIHYLRSIHVNPRSVVIQRGVRNYAGPKCPGKGWTCAGTARTVVQVASRGGKNTFACATASCAIVQVAAAPTATNTAKCIKTTGLSGSCSINQTSSSANNVAIVVQGQVAGAKMSGLSQTASYTAQITQQTTADSAFNRACVLQQVNIDGSTNLSGKKGVGVSVNLAAHQSVTVKQDSLSGANTVKRATASGNCDADGTALTQDQTLTSTATGTTGITQNQNSVDTGPNVSLDIAQNKSGGFEGATGPNTAKFNQTNTLKAIANTPAGPVSQTQSSANGGILATVNQNSQVGSTAIATQTETQCEDAHTAFTTTCHTATPDPPGYTLTQTQHGPVRKGVGDSVQTGGGSANVFTITQTSKQDNDTGSGQTNVVQGDCHTEGNCTVEQTTTVQGDTTTNTQSGQDIDTTTTCTGAECTPTCTGESCVTPEITFDGSPGTGAPPATLGPYNMTAFGADPQPLNNGPVVTSVNDPAGTIGFTPALNHSRVGNGWATWSHGYTGDVYWTNTGSTITITLPSGTTAFYLYAEPNSLSPFTVTATAQDGTTSGPTTVDGNGGARYFGFYGTGGATLAFITVTTNDTAGLGVGEFGISPSAAPPIT